MAVSLDYLIVGGGGGGGNDAGGGGGGGGVIAGTLSIASGSYAVTVGAGGAGGVGYTNRGANGQDSSFRGITGVGGGGGGSTNTGLNGGCGGGGGAAPSITPAGGTGSQGYAGGAGLGQKDWAGGGGGGMAAAGQDAYLEGFFDTVAKAGLGGNGVASTLSGASVYYGGGGGGGGYFFAVGGQGGGGTGSAGTDPGGNGTDGTGGGGGGSSSQTVKGGDGGDGVVIMRLLTASFVASSGGTKTTDGAYTIHTFSSSGTFALTLEGGPASSASGSPSGSASGSPSGSPSASLSPSGSASGSTSSSQSGSESASYSGSPRTMVVELREGDTLIASWEVPFTDTVTAFSHDLSPAEAASITDWENLSFWFIADGPSQAEVTWAALDAPLTIGSPSESASPSSSESASGSASQSPSASASGSASPSGSPSPSESASESASGSASESGSVSSSPSGSESPSSSFSLSVSQSPSESGSPSGSPSGSGSASESGSESGSASPSPEPPDELEPAEYAFEPTTPPITLDVLCTAVLRRLGDAAGTVWSCTEIRRYLEQGYLELASAGRAFWDQVYLENLPAGFSQTAAWESTDADFAYGTANYTLTDERRLLDETHRIGAANHTSPCEATDEWLSACGASPAVPATAQMPDEVLELERATWDSAEMTALSPIDLAKTDTRFQLTEGEVWAYTWRQDGIRTFRKIRVPAAQASTHVCEGTWGILRTPADITGDTTSGSRGIPRCVPTQYPIGSNHWGTPRRVYRDGTNVKVEHWRSGRSLDDADGCELPARYAYYLRDYAQARALTRVGPGQDNVLGKHYGERWQRGVARVIRRRELLQSPRVGTLTPAPVLGGGRPPRPKLPWNYGRTIRP